jgi:hypothetical protein
MNARTLLVTAALALPTLTLRAQEQPAQLDATTTLKTWETPKWEVPVEQRAMPLKLGKSDFVVSGPLVDTFRLRPRGETERTLGQKILDLPIVNMFVPEPWPKPSRQGKYFAWGEREVPWSAASDRQRSGPSGVLVSVNR